MAARFKTWGGPLTEVRTGHYGCGVNPTGVTLNRTCGTGSLTGQLDGVDTPGYYKRKARGQLLPHTYFRKWEGSCSDSGVTQYRVSFNQATCTDCSPSYTHTHLNDVPLTKITPDMALFEEFISSKNLDLDYLVQKAAGDAYASGWDGLTFLAEIHKTRDLVRKGMARLIKVFQDPNSILKFFKKNGRDWRTMTRLSAKEWLEYRYGWRILYYDILSIIEALETLDQKFSRITRTAGVTSTDQEVIVQDLSHSLRSGTLAINFQRTSTLNWVLGTRGVVTADIRPPKLQLNAVVTAWELTTFSFIVDWFINIGGWLDALSYATITSKDSSSTGIKVKLTASADSVYTSKTGSKAACVTSVSGFTGSATSQGEYSLRTPTSVPYVPLIKVNLDGLKVLDLSAILISTFVAFKAKTQMPRLGKRSRKRTPPLDLDLLTRR